MRCSGAIANFLGPSCSWPITRPAAPGRDQERRPHPVAGVHINRAWSTALRTESPVNFPDLMLNEALGQLPGNADERAPILTSVIAEPQVALTPPAEKYGCSAVVAFGHVGIHR